MTEIPLITYDKDGNATALSGREAVDCYRCAALMSGIRLLVRTGGRLQPTRGFTLTKALRMATEYTGRKYKRTEAERAMSDLKVWLENMKSTIPTETR